MQVILYTFSKRENSTKRPTDAGTPYTGNLLESCSIVKPSIGFNLGNTGKGPGAYNYAYIPEWNRYYWIDTWTWNAGLWYASMSVDALATWRDDIGASTQYVLRSSAKYNGEISDSYYPAKSDGEFTTISAFFWDNPTPRYVLGIIGNNAEKGVVTYYSMSQSEFAAFSSFLMGSTEYLGTDFGNNTIDFLKTQYNPFQYVVSVKAFPFIVPGEDVSQIPIGWYYLNASGSVVNADSVQAFVEFNVPKHPQASRGTYLNAAPYSRYALYHPSFGTIPIDGTMISKANKIRANIVIDPKTGSGVVNVDIDNYRYLQRPANIGADVQIGQITQDWAGYASSGLSAVGNALSLDWAGMATGIANAATSLLPQVQTSGQNGSFMAFSQPVYLTVEHYKIADEDNEDRGRPLCEKTQLSTIAGYIVVADGDISLPATAEENRAVKSYMEGGFFYE